MNEALKVALVVVALWLACSAFNVAVMTPLVYRAANDHFCIHSNGDIQLFITSVVIGPVMTIVYATYIIWVATASRIISRGTLAYVQYLYVAINNTRDRLQ